MVSCTQKHLLIKLILGAEKVFSSDYRDLIGKLKRNRINETCDGRKIIVNLDENGELHSKSEDVPAIRIVNNENEDISIVHFKHGKLLNGPYPYMISDCSCVVECEDQHYYFSVDGDDGNDFELFLKKNSEPLYPELSVCGYVYISTAYTIWKRTYFNCCVEKKEAWDEHNELVNYNFQINARFPY